MTISAIVPTRNRAGSLRRTLRSIVNQQRLPNEIIVVDSSDSRNELDLLKSEFTQSNIRWVHTEANVCLQRNTGIKNATSDWIFLCDDDIELPADYLRILAEYANQKKKCGAVSGRCLQSEEGVWVDQYPVANFRGLLWRFLFQLSIWGSIDGIRPPGLLRPLHSRIESFYHRKRNHLSLAGWPVITKWTSPVFETTTYSLGASMVKRDWLLHAPYDETLDPSGIGDNYGVALQFPSLCSIHVLSDATAFHHRAQENRLPAALVYYRRALALQYFIRRHSSGLSGHLWFLWSMVGHLLMFLLKGNRSMLWATTHAMWKVVTFNNPYWKARLKRQINTKPVLSLRSCI